MTDLRSLSFRKLRARHIADLDSAGPIVITSRGKPTAYLLSAEQLRQYERHATIRALGDALTRAR